MESIKDSLTCQICLEVATLPVHGKCCDKAKLVRPTCLSCVRNYLQLNMPIHKRDASKKAWAGCGCDLLIKANNSYLLYEHTYQLDQIRNLFGPSVCHHENCKASCETSEELRRHLQGTAKSSDKNNNCQEAYTKCKYCNFYNKRKIVDGEHYYLNHYIVICNVCDQRFNIHNATKHYRHHREQLRVFSENITTGLKKLEELKPPESQSNQ